MINIACNTAAERSVPVNEEQSIPSTKAQAGKDFYQHAAGKCPQHFIGHPGSLQSWTSSHELLLLTACPCLSKPADPVLMGHSRPGPLPPSLGVQWPPLQEPEQAFHES